MKTFNDLKFIEHDMAQAFGKPAWHAKLKFSNGFEVSVLCGEMFYSNGVDTYELAMLHNDCLCYTEITDGDVLGYLSEEEVTKIMKKIQELPKDYLTHSLPYYE